MQPMAKIPKQFKFKQFSLWHHRSALKVGVDGVLVGAWADVSEAKRILDVGTGCGLIALMAAQRQPYALVTGIDIDADSVDEANLNAFQSPWSERVAIRQTDFADITARPVEGQYDLILSNPPFFDSGVKEAETARLKARHQGELSPSSLLTESIRILATGGKLAMITSAESGDTLRKEAASLGYRLERECLVRGHVNAPFKRILMEWRFQPGGTEYSETESTFLTLETSPGVPTEEYRSLCRDFYLKF